MRKFSVCMIPYCEKDTAGGVMQHIATITKELRKRGYDVLRTPREDSIVHVHAAEQAPTIDVYTNHGVHPVEHESWMTLQNKTIARNYRIAGQVVCVSHHTQKELAKSVRYERVTDVIYNACPKFGEVIPFNWKALLGIEGSPLVVWGKSGVNNVLDPHPLVVLAIENPDIYFVAPIEPEYFFAKPDNLFCIGKQPPAKMRSLIQASDCYLATTMENHALQVLEAMKIGTPVVGYNWGGTAETIDKETGILVKPNDMRSLKSAVRLIVSDKMFAQSLSSRAKEVVDEKFSVERQVDELERVYNAAYWRKRLRNSSFESVIVIPVYNKAEYVAETIQSALAQDFDNYEVIIVDDGSTDNSLEIIQEAIKHNPNNVTVRIVTQENKNVSKARNFGISLSTANFITCLDADDKLAPNFLSTMVPIIRANPSLGIVYSDMMVFSENAPPGALDGSNSEFDFEKLRKGNFIPCANVFRRDAYIQTDGYREIHPSWEDYDLWLQITKRGWDAQRVPFPLFLYRMTDDGRNAQSQPHALRLRSEVNWWNRDIYPPTISVIIPCYRQARFLKEAIDSALAQTYKDVEIVVVDDGNARKEANEIERIVDSYFRPDIKLVRLTKNVGLSNARNIGVQQSAGEWLTFLDADDKLHPSFLEKSILTCRFTKNYFVYTDFYYWWYKKEKTSVCEADDYSLANNLVSRTWLVNILVSREAFMKAGGFNPAYDKKGGNEEWSFCISLGETGTAGLHVKEPLVYWRQHSRNQMHVAASRKNSLILKEMMRSEHWKSYLKLSEMMIEQKKK